MRINERGTWQKDTSKLSKEELIKQDHEIFNTARLINASTYANVVLGDFLSAILGTVRDGLSWTLDIASERRELNHTFLERGRGNSCSVEFNVIYRLHPSMSEYDATYAEKGFKYLFGEDLNVVCLFDRCVRLAGSLTVHSAFSNRSHRLHSTRNLVTFNSIVPMTAWSRSR